MFLDGGLVGCNLRPLQMFGGMEKRLKKELGSRSLEVDAIGYLVEHLE